MGLIFSKVLEMSMASILLILAVALLRIPLKRAPKWFMGVLWTIVALRLIVPIQIEAGVGFMPDFGQILGKAAGNEAFEDGNIIAARDTALPGLGAAEKGTGEDVKALRTEDRAFSGSALRYLIILWVVGMIMAASYTSYSYISIRLKTRVSIRYRSSDKVYVCDEIDTPFIFGLIKPVIYLPSGLDHDTIVNVIAHEKAHLKRKDHLRKGLGFAILTIHWFNPFVWLSYILFCRDIELACDERVISTMSTDEKKSYAESLLSCSTKKRRMMVYPVAFGEVAVRTRIRQILNYRKASFYLVLLLVVITGTLATCSFTKAADKVTIAPYSGGGYDDYREKTSESVEATAGVVNARTRIEEIKVNEQTEEVTVTINEQESAQKESVSVKEETKNDAPQAESAPVKEETESSVPQAVSVDVKEDGTDVHVSVSDTANLTSMEPVQDVVNVTEEIVDEVTDDILIEGGIADTAVDTAFGITTDTLGLVDSLLGW